MLNFKEIKEKYPKSYKLLVDWTKGTLLSFQRMIMGDLKQENLPEISDEMGEKALEGFIKVNYRLLFDFFDRNDMNISIIYDGEGLFSFRVGGIVGGSAESRTEVEIDAFNKAFEQLENK